MVNRVLWNVFCGPLIITAHLIWHSVRLVMMTGYLVWSLPFYIWELVRYWNAARIDHPELQEAVKATRRINFEVQKVRAITFDFWVQNWLYQVFKHFPEWH